MIASPSKLADMELLDTCYEMLELCARNAWEEDLEKWLKLIEVLESRLENFDYAKLDRKREEEEKEVSNFSPNNRHSYQQQGLARRQNSIV